MNDFASSIGKAQLKMHDQGMNSACRKHFQVLKLPTQLGPSAIPKCCMALRLEQASKCPIETQHIQSNMWGWAKHYVKNRQVNQWFVIFLFYYFYSSFQISYILPGVFSLGSLHFVAEARQPIEPREVSQAMPTPRRSAISPPEGFGGFEAPSIFPIIVFFGFFQAARSIEVLLM